MVLKLVKSTPEIGGPPRPLGKHGSALWKAVTAEYGIEDCGGIELLCQSCQALDNAEGFAAQIAREGSTIRTKAGLRGTPAVEARACGPRIRSSDFAPARSGRGSNQTPGWEADKLMATNRTRLKRRVLTRITPEVVDAFQRAIAVQHIYRRHLRDSSASRCRECKEYVAATHELHRLLDLPPWHESPLDAVGEMPAYMRANPSLCVTATWPQAVELRRQLEEAANASPLAPPVSG
jgi:hypothetical protein